MCVGRRFDTVIGVNANVGTIQWARRNWGALTPGDRVRFVLQALKFQASMVASMLHRNSIRADISSILPPQSDAARKAAELCAQVSPPVLFNHCARCYVWARLFAQAAALKFDDELLFASCMLHDLGLTPQYADCARHAECFTLDSVEGAAAYAKAAGWDAARRDALSEAILLHMNVVVSAIEGVEAHLLHEAAALDCLGLRAWEIARTTRAEVVARYPREGAKSWLQQAFREEARRRPRGRAAFLERYLLFQRMIRWSPFDE